MIITVHTIIFRVIRKDGVTMKLKEGIDINEFLAAAEKCSGQVFFHTADGSILNLRSMLSHYVLVSILCNKSVLEDSKVVCTQDEDYQLLKDYLE